MLYFLHGDNQRDLKDYLFDLKKRAPLVEEFDARTCAWEEFYARAKTATFLFSEKKEAACLAGRQARLDSRLDSSAKRAARQARLIAISSFAKSPAQFQKSFFEHAAELAQLPDVVVLFEDGEITDKKFLASLSSKVKIQRFNTPKKLVPRDSLTPFLFGCVNAWAQNDRHAALRAAHHFFDQGGSAEMLFWILVGRIKKMENPHAILRFLRDRFIASRLEKADLRLIIFAFLSR